jgi:hypothetical protein
VTVRNAKHELTKRAFGDLFGISEAQLERLFHQGMPHEKRAKKSYIPMPAGRVWYTEYLVQKGRKQVTPTSLDEARQRKEAAQAEMAELDLAKARDELMTASEFARVLGDAFARARARLQNLAPRIAGTVLGAETITEAQARIEPLVREAMEELRRAEDVPEPAEEEAA